jgi:hypothetical protein
MFAYRLEVACSCSMVGITLLFLETLYFLPTTYNFSPKLFGSSVTYTPACQKMSTKLIDSFSDTTINKVHTFSDNSHCS